MDVDAGDSTLIPENSHIEKYDMTDGKNISPDVESDEEDFVLPPSLSKKQSTSRSTKKRSSAVCVYTYKVDSSSLHFLSFFSRILLL
jgi:hypothetical protein